MNIAYTCEYCGASYALEENAVKCELSHVKPVKIISQRYNPKKMDNTGSPIRVVIEMDNGKEYWFKRCGEVKQDDRT